jgi:hypothetical protein
MESDDLSLSQDIFMNDSTTKVIVFALLLLLTTHQVAAAATAEISLLKTVKTDSETESRIFLDFSDLPPFRVKSSGERVDLVLWHVAIDPAFQELPEDSTLVKMEKAEEDHAITLSFLLRRPPQQVDSFLTLHHSLKKNPSPDSAGAGQLVLAIHWPPPPPKPEPAAVDVTKSRPAMTQEVIGKITVGPDKATASRRISSTYSGQWPTFFEKYEVAVHIPPVLHYSLPPFPCIELMGANSRPKVSNSTLADVYRTAIQKGKVQDWHKTSSLLEEVINNRPAQATPPPGFKLLYGESLLHDGEFAKGMKRQVLQRLKLLALATWQFWPWPPPENRMMQLMDSTFCSADLIKTIPSSPICGFWTLR